MPKKVIEVSCQFCEKTYCNQQIYYRHANRDHIQEVCDAWYPCELCQIFLPTQEVLKKHRACVHSIKEAPVRINCTFCDKTHCNTHEFYKHANKSHTEEVLSTWFPCEVCCVYFPDEDVLKNHAFQAHSNSSNEVLERVNCPFCPKHFSRTVEFYKHVNHAHVEQILLEWMQCDQCEMFFPRADVLERHASRVHSIRKMSQKSFACAFCQAALPRLEDFYVHANLEHVEEIATSWLQCDSCQTYLPDKWELDRHRTEDHSNMVLLVEDDDVEANGEGHDSSSTIFECPSCPKFFQSREMLSSHIRNVHESVTPLLPKLKRALLDATPSIQLKRSKTNSGRMDPFSANSGTNFAPSNWMRCPTCAMLLPGPSFLPLHIALHHRPAVATNGNSSHATSSAAFPQWGPSANASANGSVTLTPVLPENGIKAENEELPCPKCSQFFPNQVSLNAHILYVHNPINNLRRAAATISMANRSSFTCDFCGQNFDELSYYIAHANAIHADEVGVRWQRCDACGLAFPSHSQLNLHKVLGHCNGTGAAGNDQLTCSECGEVFSNRLYLNAHKSYVHQANGLRQYSPYSLASHFVKTELDDERLQPSTSQFVPSRCHFPEPSSSQYENSARLPEQRFAFEIKEEVFEEAN